MMSIVPDCERGFSTLKRVKTAARNQLKETTLNNLLCISIEGAEADLFDFESACDKWGRIRNRRINIL